MRDKFAIAVLVLSSLTPVSAQLMSSHASTQAPKPAAPAAVNDEKPVVRVNGVELTNRDLLREEYVIFPYARQHNGGVPKEMETGIRKGAMQMIIFEELVYQEALRRKMEIPSAQLRTAEAEFQKQFSSPEEYQQFLQVEFHGSESSLRAKIRRSLLIDALLKIEVESKSTVSVAELKSYYNQNPQRFAYPESFAIQTISFIPPAKATPEQVQEAQKRAQDALGKAKATKNYEEFGVLAESISEDDYRVMMGDHKAVDRAKIAPQVVQVLLAMKPGQVSDILQVDQVFTIIRLNQRIPAGKARLEDVQAQLQKELQDKKRNNVRSAFDKTLTHNAKIEVL